MRRRRRWLVALPTLLAVLVAALVTRPVAERASAAGAGVYFPIGVGFTDVIPHQVVRAADDRLYAFVGQAQYSAVVRVYRTSAAGLPTGGSAFQLAAQATTPANVVAVASAYDGGTIVHVLVYGNDGTLRDYPFDTGVGAFRAGLVVASGNPTVSGDYIGTGGVSAMVDQGGVLHVAHWASGNHVVHRGYRYDATTNALTLATGPTQLDGAGSASHPVVAVSPADGSLTVAWVSQASSPAAILARSGSGGSWGAVQTISTAPVWTSPYFGVNVDQGPSLVVGGDGARHLAYIEDWDSTGNYGHVHYARDAGAGWVDQALPSTYTHDPSLALDGAGTLYLFGHGLPQTPSCTDNTTLCVAQRAGGAWGAPQPFASPPHGDSFDASVSVKWSVVGFNRPDAVEILFFDAVGGNYNNTVAYYGRLAGAGVSPTPTGTATATPTTTATSTPIGGPSGTASPAASATPIPTGTTPPSPTPTPASGGNLALRGPASASSTAAGSSAADAVDGATGTYWQSAQAGTQWLSVDLGAVMPVNRVTVAWGADYATSYYVEFSTDGSTYTPVWTVTTGGTSQTVTPSGQARYVRVRATQARASDYQLAELQVFGPDVSTATPTPSTTRTPAATATPTATSAAAATTTSTPSATLTAAPTQAGSPTRTPTPVAPPSATPTPSVTAPPTPLVGDEAIEAGTDSNPAGVAEAFQYVAGGGGTATRLHAFVDASSAADQVVLGLYADRGGAPGALLAQGTLSHPVGGSWNVVAIPATAIVGGARYWIAVLAPAGTGAVTVRDGCCAPSLVSAQTTLKSLPANWRSKSNGQNSPMSAYAD